MRPGRRCGAKPGQRRTVTPACRSPALGSGGPDGARGAGLVQAAGNVAAVAPHGLVSEERESERVSWSGAGDQRGRVLKECPISQGCGHRGGRKRAVQSESTVGLHSRPGFQTQIGFTKACYPCMEKPHAVAGGRWQAPSEWPSPICRAERWFGSSLR